MAEKCHQIEILDDKIQFLTMNNAILTKELSELQQEKLEENNIMKELETKLSLISQKYEEKDRQMREMQAKLSNAVQRQSISQLAILNNWRNDFLSLKEEVIGSSKEIERSLRESVIDPLVAKMKSLQESKSMQEQAINILTESSALQLDTIAKLERKIKEIHREHAANLQEMNLMNENLATDLDHQKKTIDSKDQDNQQLLEKLTVQENEIHQLQMTLIETKNQANSVTNALRVQINELNQFLVMENSKNANCVQDLALKEQFVSKCVCQIEELEQSRSKLEHRLAEKEKEFQIQQMQQASQVNAMKEEFTAQMTSLSNQLSLRQDRIDDLSNQLAALSDSAKTGEARHKEQLEELSVAMKSLEDRYKFLQEEHQFHLKDSLEKASELNSTWKIKYEDLMVRPLQFIVSYRLG
jgi:chromosome segregation ATPase